MDSAGKCAGGSHYILLVYSKKQNTFFDLDPLCFTNGPSVKKLFDNIKELMADGSTLSETRCPQQRNGFDCGPFTLLFTERVIEKINTGEAITPIHVKPEDIKRCRSNLQKLIDEEIKSKNKGNKDRHDPRVGDRGKNNKSRTNHGVGVTEKDPKDKNEDKNKDKNNTSGQPLGQAPILVPAASAVDEVSVPDCSTDMEVASGPVPVSGQVAAPPAIPGSASVPPESQGGSDPALDVTGTSSGTQGGSVVFNNTGREARENGKYSKVCRYHQYRICRRGAECMYMHPTVCKNVEEFGLCEGKCDQIHQLVCKSFWLKGFCTRQPCGFIHPTKIWNGDGNAENRGHNQDRNDYQQHQRRTSFENRRSGGAENRGHNHNGNVYQQRQRRTSFENRQNRNNRRDYQQDQGHTRYGSRNYRNNDYNNQGYQENLSWDNTNTNFLSQQIEELMWRMKRLEEEKLKQIRWPWRQ